MHVTFIWKDGHQETYEVDSLISEKIQWSMISGSAKYLVPVRGVRVVKIEPK